MDDNKLNIYLTMHKAKQENVNKASPAGVGIDMAMAPRSWKSPYN